MTPTTTAKKIKNTYDKKRWHTNQKLRKLYKFEALQNESFSSFKKRMTKDTKLDRKILNKAIRITPIKKSHDIFDWTIHMLKNYANLKYSATN